MAAKGAKSHSFAQLRHLTCPPLKPLNPIVKCEAASLLQLPHVLASHGKSGFM